MKQSKEVLGKPIISIFAGKEVGKVKNFVINPELRSIEFIIVQNDQWDFGIKAIPFKLVEGLGEYAVTIESEKAVIDLADIPIANELLSKNIQIKGTQMVSRKGRLLGKISEYYFAIDTGKIIGCVFENAEGTTMVLPEESVVTFGKDITIIAEDTDDLLVTEETFRSTQTSPPAAVTVPNEPVAVPQSAAAMDDLELEELIGKTVSANLYDLSGQLFLAEGEKITQDIVDQVKEMGSNKALELALKVAE